MLARTTTIRLSLIRTFFMFVCTLNTFAAWQTITNPFDDLTLSLIEFKDEANIWLSASDGNVYHFLAGQWETLPPPMDPSNHTFYYTLFGSSLYANTISRTDYSTLFFHYSNNNWHKLDHRSTVPVRSIKPDHEGGLWAFGDWGTVFHIQESEITPFETPIERHIRSGYAINSDSIWLGTRNHGVYLFDKQNGFTQHLDSTWIGNDVLHLFDPGPGSISCVLDDGRVFRIQNETINPVSQFVMPEHFINIKTQPTGNIVYGLSRHSELFKLTDKAWEHIPTYPPKPLRALSFDLNGDLLVSGEQGMLLKWQEHRGLQFHNMADILSVEGSTNSHTQGAAFINLDQDEDLDLFIFNADRYQPSRLYRNHGGNLFSEISYEAGLLDIQNPVVFTFGDFDQEGSIDLAMVIKSSSDYQLRVLYQIGELQLWKHSLTITDLPLDRDPVQLLLSDPDHDNDPDLLLISRYSKGSSRGSVTLIENKWGNGFVLQDSAYPPFKASWFAGVVEMSSSESMGSTYYNLRSWAEDQIIHISDKEQTLDLTNSFFRQMDTTNTHAIALGDYDNDGDMDIFRVSSEKGLQIFCNVLGEYLDHSDSLLTVPGSFFTFAQQINLADFNNDGFLDAFISATDQSTSGNVLLMNQAGVSFEISETVSGLQSPNILGSSLGDLEGDGDIDIFGFRRGANLLWINDHDHHDHITINQTGSSSYSNNNSTYALFYEAGHSGEAEAILGRRQSRGSTSPAFSANVSNIHFGMGQHESVDIIVHSAHGQIVTFDDIPAGTVLTLSEYSGIQNLFNPIIRTVKLVINTPRIALGILGLLLNLLTQAYFAYYMKKHFKWADFPIHLSGTTNLLFYLALFYVSDFGSVWITLVLPLSVAQGLNLVVLLSHILIKKITALYAHSDKDERLLQKVMIFAHGEWALKNINGLILYFQNYETASQSDLSERVKDRINVFLDLTLPAIHDLISNLAGSFYQTNSRQELKTEIDTLENDVRAIQTQGEHWQGDAQNLANRLSELLNTMRSLKQSIYAEYSSNPYSLIKHLIKTMDEDILEQQITVELIAEGQIEQMALIKQNDLVAILENCMRNAMRAMLGQERKILRIQISEFTPRLRIQVADTGSGISHEIREKIFEPGFSESGSSGLGLFQARAILNQYAGSINLESSADTDLTTFTIDLHKGVKKA